MAMVPVFALKLEQPVQAGMVAVGKFDRVHPSLACATAGGKARTNRCQAD